MTIITNTQNLNINVHKLEPKVETSQDGSCYIVEIVDGIPVIRKVPPSYCYTVIE